jgi:hypothetical protein
MYRSVLPLGEDLSLLTTSNRQIFRIFSTIFGFLLASMECRRGYYASSRNQPAAFDANVGESVITKSHLEGRIATFVALWRLALGAWPQPCLGITLVLDGSFVYLQL